MAQGRVEIFPNNSPFIKLAILPKKIPIGATHATISEYLKKLVFLFYENMKIATMTPSNPPWKDMPPCQSLKISKEF